MADSDTQADDGRRPNETETVAASVLAGPVGKDEIRLLRDGQPLPEPSGSSLATVLLALHRRDSRNPQIVEALESCRSNCMDRDNLAPLLDWYLVVSNNSASTGECYSLPKWIPEDLLNTMESLLEVNVDDATPREVLNAVARYETACEAIESAMDLSDTGTNKFGGEGAAWEMVQEQFREWRRQISRGVSTDTPKVNLRKLMKSSAMKPGSDRWRHMERRFDALETAAGELSEAVAMLPRKGALPDASTHNLDLEVVPTVARALFSCCVEFLVDSASVKEPIEALEMECAWVTDDLSYSLNAKDRVWLSLVAHASVAEDSGLTPAWEKISEIRRRVGVLQQEGVDTTDIDYHLLVDNDIDAALAAADAAESDLDMSRLGARLDRQLVELKSQLDSSSVDDSSFAMMVQDIEADLSDGTFAEAEDRISELRQALDQSQQAERLDDLRGLLDRMLRVDGADILRADLLDAIESVEDRGERATRELVETFSDRVDQATDTYRADVLSNLTDAGERLKQVKESLSEDEYQSLEDTLSAADRSLQAGNIQAALRAVESARSDIDRRYVPTWDESRGEKSLVNHIERFMASRGQFEALDIQRLHVSLKTRRFVILAGLTGSGKSTIARGYAEAIGATGDRVVRVAVRPNWIDESEALGYVNPTTREFQPGWLASLIKSCWLDPELPHFLILDEMNLAPVEYYLADVLSAIEDVNAPGSRAKLHLYPKDASVQNASEWPAQLDYPRNLFIIGTVNIDESTRAISDRVLDRANVIQLSLGIDNSHHGTTTALAAEPPWRVKMSAWERLVRPDPSEVGHQLLVDLGKTLASIRIGIGIRSHLEVERFVSNAEGLIDPVTALDLAILQRIIPKIRGFRGEIDAQLDEIRQMVDEKGLDRCKSVFDYWLQEGTHESAYIDGTDASVGLAER